LQIFLGVILTFVFLPMQAQEFFADSLAWSARICPIVIQLLIMLRSSNGNCRARLRPVSGHGVIYRGVVGRRDFVYDDRYAVGIWR